MERQRRNKRAKWVEDEEEGSENVGYKPTGLLLRMSSSGMIRRVALVKTDVSEERITVCFSW
jgi:hypothetical protein